MIGLQQDLTAASMPYLFKIACSTHKNISSCGSLEPRSITAPVSSKTKAAGFFGGLL